MGMDHFWWGGGGPGFHFSWLWPLLIIFWFSFGHRAWAHGRARQRSMRHYAPPAQLPPAETDPALEALRTRYARGEIDLREYEERRAILLSRPPTVGPKPLAKPESAPQDNRPEWPDLG